MGHPGPVQLQRALSAQRTRLARRWAAHSKGHVSNPGAGSVLLHSRCALGPDMGPRWEAWKPGFLVCPAQPLVHTQPTSWHPRLVFPRSKGNGQRQCTGLSEVLGPDCLLSCSQLRSSEDRDTDPPHVWAYSLYLLPGPSTALVSQPGYRPAPVQPPGPGLTPACWGQGLLWKEPTCLKGPT